MEPTETKGARPDGALPSRVFPVFSPDPRPERHPGIHMPPPPLVDTPQRHSGTLEQRTDGVELMFPQRLGAPVKIGREDNDNGQQSREHRNRSDEGHKSLSLPHKRAKRFFTNWVQSTVEPTEDNDDAVSRLSNTWCRHVHQTARRLGENDCYLCSRLMAVIAGGSGREWGGTMGHVIWTSG